MKWFGAYWGAPICDDAPQVPMTEVAGRRCLYCEEEIEVDAQGVLVDYSSAEGDREEPEHIECFMRQILGSVGHQRNSCSCHGGEDRSEVGLTRREGARQAYRVFRKGHDR